MKEEAYRLKVTKKGIQAEATSASGLFYAFQSIVQLARESGNDTYQLPEVTIEDAPRFSYRGMHLDVSRHFYTKEFVKKQIDALARYKLNRFHWHLTDGAGWRIEIKKYPELTRETAYRPFPDWKSWWNGGRTYCRQDAPGASGGYYTQEDVKEIVEYARQRHITVIPEIEMPAHSEEVLAALPQLACGGGLKPGGEFCPGKELTYEFLTNVLKEVMELFPSEYIHIGGDEASTNHWKQCPDCQALMKAEGMKEEGELQEYLVSRIEKFLKENGRKMIGWDEILTGELSHHPASLTQCLFQHGEVLLHDREVGSTVCNILGGHGLHGIHGQHLLVLPGGALHNGFRELVVLALNGQHAGKSQLVHLFCKEGHHLKAGFALGGAARKGGVVAQTVIVH